MLDFVVLIYFKRDVECGEIKLPKMRFKLRNSLHVLHVKNNKSGTIINLLALLS